MRKEVWSCVFPSIAHFQQLDASLVETTSFRATTEVKKRSNKRKEKKRQQTRRKEKKRHLQTRRKERKRHLQTRRKEGQKETYYPKV